MSKPSQSPSKRNGTAAEDQPRAVIHKKILDEASASPNASIEEITKRVSGASANLVERVLDEYDDPGKVGQEASGKKSPAETSLKARGENDLETNKESKNEQALKLNQLTDKECRTLRAIFHQPEATQAEIAEELGVSHATVSNRVNGIDGFDWDSRVEIINELSDKAAMELGVNRNEQKEGFVPENSQAFKEETNGVTDQVTSLQKHITDPPTESMSIDIDPETASKMIHACYQSNLMNDKEKMMIVKTIITIFIKNKDYTNQEC